MFLINIYNQFLRGIREIIPNVFLSDLHVHLLLGGFPACEDIKDIFGQNKYKLQLYSHKTNRYEASLAS